MNTNLFARGLSEAFLEELTNGLLRPLVDLSTEKKLNLEIREDYINLYDGRGALLKLSNRKNGYKVEIHRKYEPSPAVAPKLTGSSRVNTIKASEVATWIEAFVKAFPDLQENARKFDKDEGRDEYEICMANRAGSRAAIVLDRQLQLKGTAASKVDLLAVTMSDGKPDAVVLIALKKESVSLLELMKGVDQLSNYSKLYAPQGILRTDVADSLQTIVTQKSSLGIMDETLLGQDFADLPVRCLLGLRSKAPSEFSQLQVMFDGTNVWYASIDATTSILPASARWHLVTTPPPTL